MLSKPNTFRLSNWALSTPTGSSFPRIQAEKALSRCLLLEIPLSGNSRAWTWIFLHTNTCCTTNQVSSAFYFKILMGLSVKNNWPKETKRWTVQESYAEVHLVCLPVPLGNFSYGIFNQHFNAAATSIDPGLEKQSFWILHAMNL